MIFALVFHDWFKKNSHHFLNQSEVKPKPIVISSRQFSRALRQLHVFASRFDWFTGFSVCFVIGQYTLSLVRNQHIVEMNISYQPFEIRRGTVSRT